MFGKLLKHEFKSISKWYLGLLLVTTLVAVATGNSLKNFFDQSSATSFTESSYQLGRFMSNDVVFLLLLVTLFALIISVTIASYAVIIRRFFTNLFSRQGYLTMTLPVSLHHILLSKLLVALLLFFLTYGVFFLIILAFVLPYTSLADILYAITELLREIYRSNQITLPIILVSSGIGTIQSILTMYLAMALGQLFTNHRILMSFVSYFGISILIELLYFSLLNMQVDNHYFIVLMGINTVISLIAYFVTHYTIKHKLNLE